MSTNAIALSRLLQSERQSLLRLTGRIVGNVAAAEDVTQHLWFRIQRIEDDPHIANRRAFLFRLASNLAIDHVRSERSRSAVLAEAQAFLWNEAETPNPEQAVISTAELERVLAAAATLPEPTRSIFRLHRFDGLRQSEVAVRCGVSVTTIEKHVRRALAILRKARDQA